MSYKSYQLLPYQQELLVILKYASIMFLLNVMLIPISLHVSYLIILATTCVQQLYYRIVTKLWQQNDHQFLF